MSDDDDSRFWIINSDTDIPGHPAGMYGIVDEERGGIIAWATTVDQADALIDMLAVVK